MNEPLLNLLIGTGILILVTAIFYPQIGLIAYFRKYQKLNSRELLDDILKNAMNLEMDNEIPTPERLSKSLDVSPGKILTAAAEMEGKGLLTLDGSNIHLSAEGQKLALQLIRAHRLWELYLADETGHKEDEWHNLAEAKEHQLSPAEVNALAMKLGNPLFDPHGDPIPTPEGEIGCEQGDCIYSFTINDKVVIKHIEDEPTEIFSQLMAEGFYVGMVVRIIEKDDGKIVLLSNEQQFVLARAAANNLSVMPLEAESEFSSEDETHGEALHSLKNGELGKILTISSRIRGKERRRLMDLGILPGTKVELDITSPLGNPKAYTVRGAVIALRDEQAQHIQIEKVQV